MRIKDRPEYKAKTKPLTCLADVSVSDIVGVMSEKNYGSVIVTNEDDTIAGILTERDLMRRVIADKKNPDKTKVGEVMTTDVRVANENDLVLDWLRIMSNERFRHLPIVDENNKIVSMMSQGDFVSFTWPELITRVKEQTKASLFGTYEIVMIIGALLVYAFLVNILT